MEKLNPDERWAPIPGYEGHFEASDLGRIRSLDRVILCKNGRTFRKRGRVLKLHLANSGYLYTGLWVGGVGKSRFVHSLVLETFAGPCPEGMECCHGNGDRLDNRLSNLRWGTHGENVLDTVKHGTNHKRNLVRCPRGHLLMEPNLEPGKVASGHRSCLACKRAHDYGRYCRIYGRPFDLQAEADEYYRRIMAGDLENRHKTCKRGHLLEPPNVTAAAAARGGLACLACKRTENNRQDARRAGRPFDFQTVADMHYERIMAGINAPLTGASHVA